MASAVATPLERMFGRIAGITQMTSLSQLGSTNITMQFDLNRDVDAAARDVQAAINAARGQLPANLPTNPNWRKVNPAEIDIVTISLTSDTATTPQLYDVGKLDSGAEDLADSRRRAGDRRRQLPARRARGGESAAAEQARRRPRPSAHGAHRRQCGFAQRRAFRRRRTCTCSTTTTSFPRQRVRPADRRLSKRRAGAAFRCRRRWSTARRTFATPDW